MSHTIVIFGASGDLTSRKLIPALFNLYRKDRLPADTRIVGFSRTVFTDNEWREKLAEKVRDATGDMFQLTLWNQFAERIHYQPGDIGDTSSFAALDVKLRELEGETEASRIYYLSTAPRFYAEAASRLGEAGLADESSGPRRLVVEKPFGVDLASALELNEKLHAVFDESQIYRIDHYLGKETVQNLLAFRFANGIFEPLWNRNHIDHVQITAAESVLVGSRASYYDGVGVMRDMLQNHLMQLLSLTAMEPPARLSADTIRDEKVKVLDAIRPVCGCSALDSAQIGQYEGYLDEEGVADGSRTPTFAAVRLCLDNWRWRGVPFYLRSGKAMACRTTQIVIGFKRPPLSMFEQDETPDLERNQLVFQLQPAEGIRLYFQTKVPDQGMKTRGAELGFRFAEHFHSEMPEAYERLLLDVMVGDASLFTRSDEVEASWQIFDPILKAWQSSDQPVPQYPEGQWGPTESTDWIARDGRQWFDSCPVIG